MFDKLKEKWVSLQTYKKILFIIACLSLICLAAFLINLIDDGIKLSEAGEKLQEFNNLFGASPDSVAQTLYNGYLTTFFVSFGQTLFPLIFTTTCFIFTFLNIKTKEVQNDMKMVVEEQTIVANQNLVTPIIIDTQSIENYAPSSTVSFTIPENKKFEVWKSTIEYYKISIPDIDKLQNKKLYCKPIDDKHGGLFADQTLICNLYSATHSDYIRNYGNEYCFDGFLIKTESDFIDKDLIKISVKFYIPKFTQKV